MSKKDVTGTSNILTQDNTEGDMLSAYERWEMPSMEVPRKEEDNAFVAIPRSVTSVVEEEEQEEEIKPLTAEEVEAVRQAAYDEGLAQGLEEGRATGKDEGFKSGVADARAMLTRMSQICRALLEPIPAQDEGVEQALMDLVKNICARVVQRELLLDSKSIADVVKEAIDCIHAGAKGIRIHLNPDDVEYIQQTLAAMENHDFTWQLSPHATISPGGCIVETDKSLVDARAEKRLSAIIEQVYTKQTDGLEDEPDSPANGGLGQLLGEVEHFDNSQVQGFTGEDE